MSSWLAWANMVALSGERGSDATMIVTTDRNCLKINTGK
jgi:hypothetical protein